MKHVYKKTNLCVCLSSSEKVNFFENPRKKQDITDSKQFYFRKSVKIQYKLIPIKLVNKNYMNKSKRKIFSRDAKFCVSTENFTPLNKKREIKFIILLVDPF